jgi:hypothetical protein
MAIAITNRIEGVTSNGKRSVDATVTFDNPYDLGGEPVTINQVGLKRIDEIWVDTVAQTAAGAGYTMGGVLTNPVAPKLFLWATPSTEAAAIDLSAVAFRVKFVGS